MKIAHWRTLLIPLAFAGTLSVSSAAEDRAPLNPAALVYKLPDQIP